jgi:hypothetical protein
MAQYALDWANGANDKEFPSEGDDCTNFVSQALYKGGWPRVATDWWHRGDNSKWDFFKGRFLDWASYTWAGAANLNQFVQISDRVDTLYNIWDATLGDLLFTDWDPNNTPDGQIDHVMIVTGVDTEHGVPFISQHTPAHRNISLIETLEDAQKEGKVSIGWYGRQT